MRNARPMGRKTAARETVSSSAHGKVVKPKSASQQKASDAAPRASEARRPAVCGYIDVLDPAGFISGWCAPLDPPFSPRTICILLDEAPALTGVVCDLPRPDLLQAGLGDGQHGFEVALPEAALRRGASCTVHIRDEASGEAVGPVMQVCWASEKVSRIEAQIEDISPEGIVKGWCRDRNDWTRCIDVEVLLNGAACGATRADIPRDEVRRAGGASGRKGFVFALDTTHLALRPTHTVSLRVAGSTTQIGVPVTWHWPYVSGVEGRLTTLERMVEGLAHPRNERGTQATHAAQGAPTRRSRQALRLVWLSGEMETPGHTYRVLRMVESAKALGHDARFIPVAEALGCIEDLRSSDALFIWRAPLTQELRIAIDAARFGGAVILFDVDDLMLEPELARADIIDAIRSERYDVADVRRLYQGIRETAMLADATLVTTRELGLFAQALQKPVHVLPNGFDAATLRRARRAFRRRATEPADGLLRIGYAGGSRTHQRDFGRIAAPLARMLRKHRHCRLVLFRHRDANQDLVDLSEYPALANLAAQVEWRDMVELAALPDELSRFDINLAPLETGNVFCEAKSELKFFEAALAGVATIASPTGPFRRAIRPGESGLLADSPAEWETALDRLITDVSLRRRMAQAAYHDVLRLFGPERREDRLDAVLAHLAPGRAVAKAFELAMRREASPPPALPRVPVHEVVHCADRGGDAEVSVIIPVYNYAKFVKEALDSVWHQDIETLDLIVVDDRSTDHSLQFVTDWTKRNGARFNRVVLVQNLVNSGLGLARNVGFAMAETPCVMPLDADNRLLPKCLSTCLAAIREHGAAFAYPSIVQFGDTQQVVRAEPYWPARFGGGNFIDAMALVAKSAWAAVGGYDHVRFGWEDYDFWCRLAEHGFWGAPVKDILCEYRVHRASMLRRTTDVESNKLQLAADLERRHPWVSVARILEAARAAQPPPRQSSRRAKKPPAKPRDTVVAVSRERPPSRTR
jgi:glycosyltransferase involved in cell wall biosynthesis